MGSEILPSVLGARIALGIVLLVGCSTQSPGNSVGSLRKTADDTATKSDANVLPDASHDGATRDGSLNGELPGANDAGNVCGGVTCATGDHFDVAACRCVPDTDPQGVRSLNSELPGANDAGNVCGGVACATGDHFDVATCRCVPDPVLDGAVHP
jgi:hypothetical protein